MRQKGKYYLLAYFDRDNGRDVEIMMGLMYYAERYLNCTIGLAFSYDTDRIRREKPDMVLVPNVIGSKEYILAAQFAYKAGIPVFALISEGDVRVDGSFNYWGLNDEKNFYQEYVCLWTERVKNFLAEKEKRFASKMVVTGHTGFDRYSIYRFKSKEEFLKEKGKEDFKTVVGYAAWGFGKMVYPLGREELLSYFKGDKQSLDKVEPTRQRVESMLRAAIEAHPDVLFILKAHPNERPPTGAALQEKNEISALKDYPNVVYEGTDALIHDIIHVSDLWMSFESTTAIEAWVLERPTVLLMPVKDFSPAVRNKGLDVSQLVVSDEKGLIATIEHLKTSGVPEEFYSPIQSQTRAKIIAETVGFADGLNHVRAGHFLERSLSKIPVGHGLSRKVAFSFREYLLYALIVLGRLFYNRKVYSLFGKTRKFIWVFEQYTLERLNLQRNRNKEFFELFHEKHSIPQMRKDPDFIRKVLKIDTD